MYDPALRARAGGGSRLLPVWTVRATVGRVGKRGDIRETDDNGRALAGHTAPEPTSPSSLPFAYNRQREVHYHNFAR